MVRLTSGILSERKHIENKLFQANGTKQKLRLLAEYMDNIFVIFDNVIVNEDSILDGLNNTENTIQSIQGK